MGRNIITLASSGAHWLQDRFRQNNKSFPCLAGNLEDFLFFEQLPNYPAPWIPVNFKTNFSANAINSILFMRIDLFILCMFRRLELEFRCIVKLKSCNTYITLWKKRIFYLGIIFFCCNRHWLPNIYFLLKSLIQHVNKTTTHKAILLYHATWSSNFLLLFLIKIAMHECTVAGEKSTGRFV